MLPILRAINNLTMSKPAKRRKKTPAEEFKLVKKRTQFDSSEEVMRFLPDILGRALTRSWIDREFQTDFMLDPEGVLARYAVFLPPNVTTELETEGVTRPKVVVYGTTRLGKQKRLMYLQLVMMEGK